MMLMRTAPRMMTLALLLLLCAISAGAKASETDTVAITTTKPWNRRDKPFPYYLQWNSQLGALEEMRVDVKTLPRGADAARPSFYSGDHPRNVPFVGQVGQDRLVTEILRNKTDGFFVDLAANDYKCISNTYALERNLNWGGLCIETNPEYHGNLLAFRKCILAINPVDTFSNHQVKFRFRGAFSGIADNDTDNDPNATIPPSAHNRAKYMFVERTLTTVTLLQLLQHVKAPPVIDFLSLDIEGAEFRAMKNFDFGLYTFLVVNIERPKPELHHLLLRNHYHFLRENVNFGDLLYVHESIPHFDEIMLAHVAARDAEWVNAHPYILAKHSTTHGHGHGHLRR